MIIAKVNAGLCNQIYFFSTAYALSKEWNEELIIDCDVDGNPEWTYLLDEFQMPSYQKVIYPLRYNIGKEYVKIAPEIKEHAVIIDETYFEEVGDYLTIPKEKFQREYPGKDIYLKGTFLMRQMFTKYISDLRKIFTLKESSPFVREFENRIEHITAVGVHIRKQGFAVLGDDNGMDFFEAAIVYMRQRYENARFYIFSDELDSIKESLGGADDIFYVDAMNGYRGDIEEFVCLTKCHHYILTRRSTYGRMAEILNPSTQKLSVLFGGNTWNDSEERFYFMSQEEVQELSKLFVKGQCVHNFQNSCLQSKIDAEREHSLINFGLDNGGGTNENRRRILYQKARIHVRRKEYGKAVHLCRLLEEQYGEDSIDFHEFFGDVLYKYGAIHESIVEYLLVSAEKLLKTDLFKEKVFSDYKQLFAQKEKKHYVIVQYGIYDSQYLSEMQMLGLILGRMGNSVSFVFKRVQMEISEKDVNIAMLSWANNVNNKWLDKIIKEGFSIGRFFYGFPCYEYGFILERKNENLQKIASRYPEKETFILGRDPQLISSDVPFRKIFVDFSEPFDEAYLREEIGKEAIDRMYKCADIVITRENNCLRTGKTSIQMNDGLLDTSMCKTDDKVPYYLPTVYTNDYLDIALKIALNSI